MALTEKERQILKTFEEVLPNLTEKEKDRILYIGEGLSLKTEKLARKKTRKQDRRCGEKGWKICKSIHRENCVRYPKG